MYVRVCVCGGGRGDRDSVNLEIMSLSSAWNQRIYLDVRGLGRGEGGTIVDGELIPLSSFCTKHFIWLLGSTWGRFVCLFVGWLLNVPATG